MSLKNRMLSSGEVSVGEEEETISIDGRSGKIYAREGQVAGQKLTEIEEVRKLMEWSGRVSKIRVLSMGTGDEEC